MTPPFRAVVIDDDADLRALVGATLRFTAGWEVAIAGDGASGIEAVRRERPDVVIIDLMMPDMDGYEVSRRLRSDPETAAIPRVLLTARALLDEASARAAGARGVIVKPFELDALARQVSELCAESGDG